MAEVRIIDKTIPIPLYYQLKTILLEDIKKGKYPVGSMIPTEMELCSIYEISRTTVRQAILELVREGLLVRIKSKGTFVARQKYNQDFIRKLESYNEQIKRIGGKPGTDVIVFRMEKADEMCADKLCIPVGSDVVHLLRRRYANDEPIVIVDTYVPADPCAFLLEHDMTKESLYDVLAENETSRVDRVVRVVEAVGADKSTSELLGIKKGSPIQSFTSVGYNKSNMAIEYTHSYFRGDQNKFEMELYREY